MTKYILKASSKQTVKIFHEIHHTVNIMFTIQVFVFCLIEVIRVEVHLLDEQWRSFAYNVIKYIVKCLDVKIWYNGRITPAKSKFLRQITNMDFKFRFF